MLRRRWKCCRRASILILAAALGSAVGPAEGAGQAAIPSGLVGNWGFAVATGEYCTDLSHCAPGGGGSIAFTFRPDGSANYTVFQSTMVDGCGQIQTLVVQTGKIQVRGGIIVFTPSAGTYKSVNGCRPDLTGTWKYGAENLKPVTLHWRYEGDSLRITDPSGEASGVYRRR